MYVFVKYICVAILCSPFGFLATNYIFIKYIYIILDFDYMRACWQLLENSVVCIKLDITFVITMTGLILLLVDWPPLSSREHQSSSRRCFVTDMTYLTITFPRYYFFLAICNVLKFWPSCFQRFCLIFSPQSVNYGWTCWKSFHKRVVCTKSDTYLFI